MQAHTKSHGVAYSVNLTGDDVVGIETATCLDFTFTFAVLQLLTRRLEEGADVLACHHVERRREVENPGANLISKDLSVNFHTLRHGEHVSNLKDGNSLSRLRFGMCASRH